MNMNIVSDAQKLITDANERFSKKLELQFFPIKDLSDQWKYFAKKALLKAAMMKLGINPEDYDRLIGFFSNGEALSLYHFAILSNNLQNTSPDQLDIDLEDYQLVMIEAEKHVKIWTELSTAVRDELDKEIQEEDQIRAAVLVEKVKKENLKKDGGLRAEA